MLRFRGNRAFDHRSDIYYLSVTQSSEMFSVHVAQELLALSALILFVVPANLAGLSAVRKLGTHNQGILLATL